jgi:tripartite-type tricarboxylate transporter receptor subunit TctC
MADVTPACRSGEVRRVDLCYRDSAAMRPIGPARETSRIGTSNENGSATIHHRSMRTDMTNMDVLRSGVRTGSPCIRFGAGWRACAAGATAILFLVPAGAAGAAYPERPIRIIVPAGVGGGSDIGTRLFAAELTRQLGQHVVVENRPGAGGIVGTEAIARAAADGYTLGQGNFNSMNTNRILNANLPYNADKDLQAIVFAYMSRNIIAVNRALPVSSVKDLVSHARANPGKLLYASGGNGSSGHFSGALLGLLAGIEMVHVPYKASGPAITDLVAGQVHLMSDNVQSIGPHVRAGRLRGLAVTTTNRTAAYPDLPTVAEAGIPGFEIAPWAGYIAPAGVPRAIVARLNAEFNRVFAVPAVREKLIEMGLEPRGGTPEAFARFMRDEVAKWTDVARRANVRGE